MSIEKENPYLRIEKLPWKQKSAIDRLMEIIDECNAETAAANKKLNAALDFRPAKLLKDHLWETEIHKKVWSEQKYLSYAGKYSDSLPLMTAEQVKSIWERDKAVYEENKIIAADNQKSLDVAMTLLLKLGLKTTKTEKISSRSYKTREVLQAWVGEVEKAFPKNADCVWKLAEGTYKLQIEKIEKYHKDIADKKIAAEKEKANELKNQEKTAILVSLTQKYGFKFGSPIPDINDLIEELIKKNKYLYLAVYLSRNRSDWSDASDYAETGLAGFTPENKLEHEIYNEIQSYCTDWDGDGRVFRNATYSYDVLFEMVKEQSPELYEDYQKLSQYVNGY